MNKRRVHAFLLLALGCSLIFSGCRRKPVETESETTSETETETETEKETEKQSETKKETEKQKQSETQKQTEKKTTVTPNTTVQTPTSETTAPQTEAAAAATDQCPYCYNWFSTAQNADGSSEYSTHVAAEKAYAEQNNYSGANDNDYDPSEYYTDPYGGEYAQCGYCGQWFSTAADDTGYSPYSEHVANEAAYAAQMSASNYVQCPYCGYWVSEADYEYHTANGI